MEPRTVARERTKLVIRPSVNAYRRARRGGVGAVGVGLFAVAQASKAGLWGVAIVAVTTLCCVLSVWLYLRRVRFEVTEDEVARFGVLRTRRFPMTNVGTVLAVDQLALAMGMPIAYVIGMDGAGRRLFQLTSGVWDDPDRQALLDAMSDSVVIERYTKLTTSAELAEQHPHALSPVQRHPIVTGLALALVVIGGAIAAGFIWQSTG